MKLQSLLTGLKCKTIGNPEIDIQDIQNNSAKITNNSLFVAINGTKTNGEAFAHDAVQKGAVAVVSSHPIENLNATQIIVKDPREMCGILASRFFGEPSKHLTMIGITGTNGKTSTTYMIKHILEQNGKKVGVIGTSGYVWNNKTSTSALTTPDSIELQHMLATMLADGINTVAMEVSAHALDLNRTSGIVFDKAVFTNLTRDHLDYFKTMDNYFTAKAKLFTPQMCKEAIICTDNQSGKLLAKNASVPVQTYSTKNHANYFACRINHTPAGQTFIVGENHHLVNAFLPLFGHFNCQNAMAAIATCCSLGTSLPACVEAAKTMPQIGGRFNTIVMPNGGLVIIDYAHTPDGLLNVLTTSRELAEARRGRLISLFGCGGNRDTTKRPIMGEISENLADYTIITSDNPRNEDPQQIIDQIAFGMNQNTHTQIPDREKAIQTALKILGVNDVLLIAGKGQEDYIEQNGCRFPYSDYWVVNRAISAYSQKE